MIGAALRLALLISLLAAITVAQFVRSDAGTPVTLAAGALLLCALFAGSVARGFGLPRLTGYLLIGIAIGPYVLKFIPAEGVDGLELVKGLAVSLIAFSAGAELHLGLVRRVGRRVLVLCALISLAVFLTSSGALLALRPFLPFLRELGWHQAAAVSALVATVIVSFSPTRRPSPESADSTGNGTRIEPSYSAGGTTPLGLGLPPGRAAGRVVGQGADAVPALLKALHEEAKVI